MQLSLFSKSQPPEIQVCEACRGVIKDGEGFVKHSTQSVNESGRPIEIDIMIYHCDCEAIANEKGGEYENLLENIV